MIVKDEELTLKNCLSSVKTLVDEIIIVDTGSCDRTKAIAAEFTDRIFDFEWIDDFSAARNFSFSQATMDYILWLDADDIILSGDIVKFQRLKENLTFETDVVMLKYNTGFDKDGNAIFSYFRERLVKRSAGFVWKEPVHEYIETQGRVINGEPAVTHTVKPRVAGRRNLNIYEKILKNNGQLSPRGTYYYARELKDADRYKDAALYFEKFIQSGKGWNEDNIEACSSLSECLFLLDDSASALKYLFKSFEYDNPRPKICCQLGDYFKRKNRYRQAIFWFELAHKTPDDYNSWGFRQKDYSGYVPCLELCVCYSRIGNNQKAFEFNEKAAEFRPDCPSVRDNRIFLKNQTKSFIRINQSQ